MKTTCHNSEIIKDKYNNTYCSYCLKHNPKPVKGKNWTLIAIFFLGMLGIYGFCKAPSLNKLIKFTALEIDSCSILSDSALIRELYEDDCVLIAVAVAQAKIESGSSYNSNIAIQNHNLFGIKAHKCKYVKSSNLGHAVFKDWKDCCKCYCKIQNLYLNKIDKHYAMDKNYITTIKSM
tara:strand:+ start:618 stop:1151 length:534 start_codon:yes stop_codon:yes gene_type:complete